MTIPEVHMVRVYQSVQFEKKQLSTFYTDGQNNNPSVEITILADQLMIEFKSAKDCVWVPYTNISAIHLKSSIRKENDAENKKNEQAMRDIVHKPVKKLRR